MLTLIRNLKLERSNLIQENKTIQDSGQFLRNQSKIIDLGIDIDVLEAAQEIVNRYEGTK